ncbi:MAG: RNA polymerase sporulation sigma factor SigH [Lachnospiraceae bacterium]|nr:RNA polymerase sporulation sigma factor SigH [Lachnospiraceae bacterium]
MKKSADRYDNGVSDDELIIMLRDGDERIVDRLMDKYKDLVKSKAKSMYILGAEPEDLIQEGMIGLFKAIRDYDIGRDASFATFAQLCVNRQMYNALQASNRQKHIPLNSYVSLYSKPEGDNDNDTELIENVAATTDFNPESMMIDRENVTALEKAIDEALSPLEKQVLDLFMTGMGYVEIAGVLGRDEKSTDNALQRARGKVKKLIF